MKKLVKILLIMMISIMMVETVYAVEGNEVNNTVESTSTSDEKMSIEVTGAETQNAGEEVSLDVNLKNANCINGGSIKLMYDSRLQYLGATDRTSEYTITEANNEETKIIIIAFSSNVAGSGDIKLCSIKFKLPDNISEETNYDISFGEETSLITANSSKSTYELVPATIHYISGNSNSQGSEKKFDYKYVIIGAVVIVLLIIILGIAKSKKTKE